MELANKLFKGDRVIWIIFMFLFLVSVIEVFSATSTIAYRQSNFWAPIMRHASFLIVGFFSMLVIQNIPCRFLSGLIILLPISIILLFVTPFIGVSANDAHRWLDLFGFQFQPSEFAKLSSIVFVAFMLSRRSKFTEKTIFTSILVGVGIACFLILPENFSTAVMLFGVCYLMMFIGQVPFKKMAKLTGVLILSMSLFLLLLINMPKNIAEHLPKRFETWQARIERFFKPDKAEDTNATFKITDDNFQETHAKIAIARGGLIGQMPGHGQQRDFLPQAYSDFIYAIIIEELGFIGGMGVLALYVILMFRVGIIARRCDKLFPKYLVLGCGLLIVIQALANMAVAVDLIPVTGQPMPLVSRGGTSTVMSCIYFGIILSISRFGAGMGEDISTPAGEIEDTANQEDIEDQNEEMKTVEVDISEVLEDNEK